MKFYAGIDLHCHNNVLLVSNEQDQVLCRKQLSNGLTVVLQALEPFRAELAGVVVESTYATRVEVAGVPL